MQHKYVQYLVFCMKLIQSAGLSCIALLAFGCGRSMIPSGDIFVIDLATAMSQQTTLKASEYFSEIRYIPLETSDTCLIGNNPVIRFAGENILITTSTRSYSQAMLFDASGSFIRNIGHIGNDPEGYGSVRCFVDDFKELIYFQGFGNSLTAYGFDGKFAGKIPTHTISDMWMTYFFLNGDTLLGYQSDPIGNAFNGITIFNASGKIDSIPSNLPELTMEGASMARALSRDVYGPVGYEGISYFWGRETTFIWMPGATVFWHQDRETYFKEPFNDTIFVIRQNTLIPRLVLELGNYHWDAADRMRPDMDKGLFFTQFFENNDILFFRFLTRVYDDNEFKNLKSYNAMYHKSTGNIKIAPFNEGVMDDLTHFLPLQPCAVSSSGVYAGLLNPVDILEWLEKQGDRATIPAEIQRLKQLNEEDNPVLVLMK